MSRIFFYPVLAILFLSSSIEHPPIVGYHISQILPDVSSGGKIIGYDTSSAQVFYRGDLILYKLYYLHSTVKNGVTLVKDEKRTHYVLFRKGDRYGYDFDDHKRPYQRTVLLDSVFGGEWVKQTKLYPMFENNLPKLISSTRRSDSLIEIYKVRDKNDSIDIADFKLKFTTSIKDIELSISKEFDSVKNMKLYELSFLCNPNYIRRFGIVEGKYYSYYHLKKIKNVDYKTIVTFFDAYRPPDPAVTPSH